MSDQAMLELLEPFKPSGSGLFRAQMKEPYAVATGQPGLSLMVQCLNGDQPPDKRLWGLHAMSFQTRKASEGDCWAGPWPKGLDPNLAKSDDVVHLLMETGAAENKTPQANVKPAQVQLNTPNLCCIEVPGYNNVRWMVQGLFDFGSLTLTHLMVMRAGDWLLPTQAGPAMQKSPQLM